MGKLALRPGVEYPVIGIESDYYRILDDDGEPVLFPPDLFIVTDESVPGSWIVEWGEEGDVCAYPPELSRPGFFEDYFDGDEKCREIFWRVIKR